MDDELAWMTIAELAAAYRKKALSPVEVTQHFLRRIATHEPDLNAFACLTEDRAMQAAKHCERDFQRGDFRGPLHGIPIGLKDLCFTRGIPTSAGMRVHREFRPEFDATVAERLQQAGTILLGKLQLTEGGFARHHPDIDPPKNPWNPDLWPGVSSSGSGVAIAAGLCCASIGTDTGGSIRYPSAVNGVTGLKPTWGRVSRHGMFELAASLDHVGPICRSAEDCGLMLQAMAGLDARDPTSLDAMVPDYLTGGYTSLSGIRIGVDEAYNGTGADPETLCALARALDAMKSLGAEIVPVTVPDPTASIEDWPLHCQIEAAVAHSGTYPAEKDAYGPWLSAGLENGRSLPAILFQQMRLRRMEFTGRLRTLLSQVDLLLTPVLPFAAPTLEDMDAIEPSPEGLADLLRFTVPFNMAGVPAIALPAGLTAAGYPVAIQLVARDLGEQVLIRAGRILQQHTRWHRERPKLFAGTRQVTVEAAA